MNASTHSKEDKIFFWCYVETEMTYTLTSFTEEKLAQKDDRLIHMRYSG